MPGGSPARPGIAHRLLVRGAPSPDLFLGTATPRDYSPAECYHPAEKQADNNIGLRVFVGPGSSHPGFFLSRTWGYVPAAARD